MAGDKIFFISVFLYFMATVSTQDANVTIPLNKTLTALNKELFGGFYTLNGSSTLQLNFIDVNQNVSYIVIQAHSHIRNITLYQDASMLTGTNIGLVGFTVPQLKPYYVLNPNENITLQIYLSVHGYKMYDPVPGGCNMELSGNTAAYLRVTTTSNYLMVDAGAPQLGNLSCQHVVSTLFYMMYLPEMNFDSDVYFDGIRNMMTYDKIMEHGVLLPVESMYWAMRRMVSAYPGTGVVFVAVAINVPDYAVYVPASTYGCQMDGDACELIYDPFSEFLCAGLFFVGIFLCYFGHRFFKTEMFLAGFFTGVIITYVLITMQTDIATPVLVGASVLSGIFFGCIWLLFWWLYSIPVLAVLLPSLNFGFLLASIFYYRLPVITLYMNNDANFWVLFLTVMLLTSLSLVTVTFAANILSCAVLGAYATVYALDYYLGSNLKYILINTVRRAVVTNFNKAILSPPFQWRDALVTSIWIALAVSGFLFQHIHNRGRPPFPPPPRSTRQSPESPRAYGAIPNQRIQQRQRNGTTASPGPDETTRLLV